MLQIRACTRVYIWLAAIDNCAPACTYAHARDPVQLDALSCLTRLLVLVLISSSSLFSIRCYLDVLLVNRPPSVLSTRVVCVRLVFVWGDPVCARLFV